MAVPSPATEGIPNGASGNFGTQMPRAITLHGDPVDGDSLTFVALAYLSLPSLIFLFGWCRLPVALVACFALAFAFVSVANSGTRLERSGHSKGAMLLIGIAALVWASFSGGSHFMYADHDWTIRDAVLGDLIRADWPVLYSDTDGSALLLRSAIGYFLVPAVFGKLFGLAHIDLAIFFWTAAGTAIFLLLLPLPKVFGLRLFAAVAVSIFFSGMDFLGILLATGTTPIFPLRLEWWVPLSYPSLTGQLLWAPNHALAIWIGAALIYRHRGAKGFLAIAVVLLPLTLVWTPFAAIGLIPFVVLGGRSALTAGDSCTPFWRTLFAAALFAAPISLYLLADLGSIDFSTSATVVPGPVVNVAKQPITAAAYLTFVSCEFMLLSLVLAAHSRNSLDFLGLSSVVLLLLPFFNFGPSNDSLLRLSTPPLVMLLAICLNTLFAAPFRQTPPLLWIAWLFLAIGAHTAFNELWRAATFPRWVADYDHTLAERQGGRPAAHYVGRLGTSLIRHLLKPVSLSLSTSQIAPDKGIKANTSVVMKHGTRP